MSNAIGESISRIVEFSGAEVKRANYQGDVGLHVVAVYKLINGISYGHANEQATVIALSGYSVRNSNCSIVGNGC